MGKAFLSLGVLGFQGFSVFRGLGFRALEGLGCETSGKFSVQVKGVAQGKASGSPNPL